MAYRESENYRPEPWAVTGNLDTTEAGGMGGFAHSVEKIAPIFQRAAEEDIAYALRALDPEDTEVREEDHVQTTPGITVVRGDPDEQRARIHKRAQMIRSNSQGSSADG